MRAGRSLLNADVYKRASEHFRRWNLTWLSSSFDQSPWMFFLLQKPAIAAEIERLQLEK